MNWRHALAALFLTAAPYALAAAEAPTPVDLAEGAAIVATCRLSQDADDPPGRQLLAFALAMDPENDRALLIQARLERGQELDPAELADGGRQFVEFVERAAAKARPKARALLYYRVIELVDPKHEKALLELTRAKNQGVNTDFATLLRALRAKDDGRAAGSDEPPAERDVLKVLGDTSFQATGYSELGLFADPIRLVNQLNQLLRPAGVSIRVESRTRPVEGLERRTSDGVPYMYSTAFQSRAFRSPGVSSADAYRDQLTGLNGGQILLLLCVLHDLGWKDAGDRLILVDREDATGADAGTVIDGRDLVAQAKRSQVDFLKAYRRKDLVLWGLVSGVGKGSSRYLHLAGDQVRLYLAPGTATEQLARLDDTYGMVQKAERAQRGVTRGDGGAQALLLVARGKCDGISSGRITFRNVRDLTFMRVFETRHN